METEIKETCKTCKDKSESLPETKKKCKRCNAGNKVAKTTIMIALSGAFLMIYGLVSIIKDIISLFTQ
jgi:hypothetical protein